MKKRMVSLILALVMCISIFSVSVSSAEDAIPPAGVLSFLNYSEEEFAEASVIWNYLGISLFNNGYVASEVMTPMDPSYALQATAADYPVKFYDTLDSMVLGLLSGEIISFDIYSCVAKYICARNDQLVNYVTYDTTSDRSGFVAEVLDRFSNGFSFMMLESKTALRDEFNQAIEAMKADGTLDKLIDEHINKVIDGGEPQEIKPDVIEGAETITVAVTGCLPPMDYVAPDGTVAGFNTAILAEIGRRIGKNIKFSQVDSAGRALALATGAVDVVFWVRGVATGSKTINMTDEEFAAYKAEIEKDFTPEEKEAIAHLDEILPRVREYNRDMPEGTIITEPYYTDIPVGVMTKQLYDMYVAMIKGQQ
jgi:ABC-type amino acid transport substrate-binding protein